MCRQAFHLRVTYFSPRGQQASAGKKADNYNGFAPLRPGAFTE